MHTAKASAGSVFSAWHTCSLQVMEDDEHYVDDPKNPQFQHHGGEYAYQGGNSGGDFEGEGFQGEHEGFEASGTVHQPCRHTTVCCTHSGLSTTLHANSRSASLPSPLLVIFCAVQLSEQCFGL
jgi:hypothetical protein